MAAEQPQQPLQPEPEPIPAPVQYTQQQQQEPVPEPAPMPVTPAPALINQQQQPDVIPLQRESIQSDIYETVAPPPAFSSNGNGIVAENVPEIVQSVPNPVADEQIYSNINYEQQPVDIHAPPLEAGQINPTILAGNDDCNLSDYIEDTKIQALALYDYQASAEDEISFDPNDVITHIEKVRHRIFRYFRLGYVKNFNAFHFPYTICRSMRAGGVDFVKINTDCFQRIMCKLQNKHGDYFFYMAIGIFFITKISFVTLF